MFAIVTNKEKDKQGEMTRWVTEFLEEHQREYALVEQQGREQGMICSEVADLPKQLEAVIVLGGDGTVIQTAHDFLTWNIPIMGINLGTLGFLAEVEKQNIAFGLEKLLKKEYSIEERSMLSLNVNTKQGKEKKVALNDVVITRKGFSRVIEIEVSVNDYLVNSYSGDGVIVSTPTGSTGYALSAGGPIVAPESELLMITPICPHSLSARTIIVAKEDRVTLRIISRRNRLEDAVALVDGVYGIDLCVGDQAEICMASEKTKLVRLQKESFFDRLHKKLNTEASH